MAVDRWRNYSTPSLVVGTLLSIVVSFVLYLADVTDLGTSLVVGLVGVVLSVEIDLLDRDEFSSVFANRDWTRHRIREIGELCAEVADHDTDVTRDELQRKLAQFVADLQEVARGRVRRPASDLGLMLELTDLARHEMRGVTSSADPDGPPAFWRSNTGAKYWERNRAALRRGVRLTRIFVLPTHSVADLLAGGGPERLRSFLDGQSVAGVAVWLVAAERAPHEARVNFVVWDRRSVLEPRLDVNAEPLYNSFSSDAMDARLALERFDLLLLEADRYRPALSPAGGGGDDSGPDEAGGPGPDGEGGHAGLGARPGPAGGADHDAGDAGDP